MIKDWLLRILASLSIARRENERGERYGGLIDNSGYPGTVLHMQYHSTLAVPDLFFLRQVTKKL